MKTAISCKLKIKIIFFTEKEMLQSGFPAYTTSAGWLGYSDAKIKDVRKNLKILDLLCNNYFIKKYLIKKFIYLFFS